MLSFDRENAAKQCKCTAPCFALQANQSVLGHTESVESANLFNMEKHMMWVESEECKLQDDSSANVKAEYPTDEDNLQDTELDLDAEVNRSGNGSSNDKVELLTKDEKNESEESAPLMIGL